MTLIYGEQRAVNELRSILSSQWKNGMLPQIRFTPGQIGYSPDAEEWGVKREISGANVDTSGITQPPNVALALWNLYKGSNNQTDLIPVLEEMYEPLKRYHDFLLTERDPNGDGLAAIFHPWAAGTDNAPCYDDLIEATRLELVAQGHEQRIQKRKDISGVIAEYRPGEKDYETYGRLIGFFIAHDYDQEAIYSQSPFVVQDVMFNSILAESIQSLGHIADELFLYYGDKADEFQKSEHYAEEHKKNHDLAGKVKDAIREKLYDTETGMFYNFDVRGGKLLTIPTIHSISPLFGHVADQNQAERLLAYLQDAEMFNLENGFAVPTTPLNSLRFDNQMYWRGPVWPVTNWIIARGVEHYDADLAKKLNDQTIRMISEGHDTSELKGLAASLMEYTSFGEAFTTPSRAQYQHGWLWDSGFAAIGWRHVEDKPSPEIWEKVRERKEQLLQGDIDLKDIRVTLGKEFDIPLFDEYYAPTTTRTEIAGSPLGAEMMTWTAALFLDLLKQRE